MAPLREQIECSDTAHLGRSCSSRYVPLIILLRGGRDIRSLVVSQDPAFEQSQSVEPAYDDGAEGQE